MREREHSKMTLEVFSLRQEDWSSLPNKLDGERLGVEQVGQGEGKSEI